MKIRIDNFKGTAPRVSDRSLGNGFAKTAENARLRSTDLESYYTDSSTGGVLIGGDTNAIYPMDADGTNGGPFWLSWNETEATVHDKIDVARGFVLNDDEERTYFTGNGYPKVTTLELATGTPPGNDAYPYPTSEYRVGVPTMESYKVVPSFVLSAPTYTSKATYDGTSLGEFQGRNATDVSSIESSTTVFNIVDEDDSQPSVINTAYTVGHTAASKLTMTLTGATNAPDIAVLLGMDDDGNGTALNFNFSSPTLTVTIVSVYNYKYTLSKVLSYPSGDNVGTNGTIEIEILADTTDTLLESPARTVLITGSGFDCSADIAFNGYKWGFASGKGATTATAATIDDIEVEVAGEDALLTNYVFTAVNTFGEESIPSAPSKDVLKSDDYAISFTVPNLTSVDASYHLDAKRIYRAATSSAGTTEYLFVKDETVAAGTSSDDVDWDDIGPDVLDSFDFAEPDAEAHSIVALSNGIMLVAKDNTIYPSVSYRPHAYPPNYSIAVDGDIVTMVAVENQAVILTGEGAYVLYGDDPSAMTLVTVPQRYGCISSKSVVRWAGFGVVYASSDGLVAVNGSAATLLTEPYITKREWGDYYPDTIVAAVHDDVYHGWYDDGASGAGFIFDPRSQEVGFTSTTTSATATHTNPFDDTLFYADSGVLYEFEGSSPTKTSYTWLSKRYLLPHPTAFECAQIRVLEETDGEQENEGTVTMKLYKDAESTAFFTKSFADSDPIPEFLLPSDTCRELCIELTGTSRVRSVEIAEDMGELE